MKCETHVSSRCTAAAAAAEAGMADAEPGGWHNPAGIPPAPAWQT